MRRTNDPFLKTDFDTVRAAIFSSDKAVLALREIDSRLCLLRYSLQMVLRATPGILVRPAAGSAPLEAMLDRVQWVNNWGYLKALLQEQYSHLGPTSDNISIEKYGDGIDERCGWDTHLVCIDGKAAVFTSGPVEGAP